MRLWKQMNCFARKRRLSSEEEGEGHKREGKTVETKASPHASEEAVQ